MNNILLLGFTIPDAEFSQLYMIDKAPAVQTHRFAWKLASAISSTDFSLHLLSTVPVQSWPHGKRIFFPFKRFSTAGLSGLMIPFVNLIIFKHISRFIFGFACVLYFVCFKHVKHIIIHGVHSPFLLISCLFRQLGVKIIYVVTDPPGVILNSDGFFAKILKYLDKYFVKKLLKQSDAFISLSKHIEADYSLSGKSMCLPGIVDDVIGGFPFNSLKSGEPFVLCYAGTLDERYGVLKLIEAVLGISDIPIVLKLFGSGDSVFEIKKLEVDTRVQYGGMLSADKIYDEYLNIHAFVNPRPISEEYSTHSFPSKLLEYALFNRPVITTKIKSMPPELMGSFYFTADDSATSIRETILEVYSLFTNGFDDLSLNVVATREVVVKNYSITSVGKRIENLIRSI